MKREKNTQFKSVQNKTYKLCSILSPSNFHFSEVASIKFAIYLSKTFYLYVYEYTVYIYQNILQLGWFYN